ncbi:hypothetical protein J3B02_001784 [Coemansia erecta]|uniref:Uncharacterized protein n=1 Tax=Coemansia asiatica TaxID=1052880 RepID=A0A9W7XNH6_9FUNG|nr:hypothetical protein LPJ64_001721 [Coemansia asiatica]KAJ2856119.1 hypothetical protein J3B02_001784 [Coemansia erecta]
MTSSLPSRRPRHQRHRKQNVTSAALQPNRESANNGSGWLCMPCLPQDIIESTQYEATIVGRTTKPRQPCAFTESQAMGLALILAEQYVRAADTCPLTASQMPLEHPVEATESIGSGANTSNKNKYKPDNEGFVNARWSPEPHTESLESLLSASTVSPTCSPNLSSQSHISIENEKEQKSLRNLGFLTLPLRSTRAVSSSGSTVFGSSLLSINVHSGSKHAKSDNNRLRRPVQWIRNLFS